MATSKAIKATANYEKDTAKGKKRYRVEGKGIAGTLYLEKEGPDSFEVTLTPTEE